jgi:hypothetical protein
VVLAVLLGGRLWLQEVTPASPSVARPAPSPAGTRLEAAVPSVTPPPPTVGITQPVATPAAVSPRRLAPEAFGRLPPLALPGDGGFGPRLALDYERASSLGTLPDSVDVHQLMWPTHTPDSVRDLGRRLGLSGAVDALGPDVYQLLDQANGRLYVAHGRVIFSRGGERPETVSIDPDRAAELARDWLSQRQLLPADAGPPLARLYPEARLITVIFAPDSPRPLTTPEPSITMLVDGLGAVREMDALWPAERAVSTYPLSGLNAAWDALLQGDGYVEIETVPRDLPDQRLTGQARLTSVTIGYALAAGTDAAAAAYLQPIYIFSGTVQLAGEPGPVACLVYVPALRDYPWPRG